MKLTNPTWIHHSGGAIYSIDFHPLGTKIATCGQGSEGGSGLVVIWNVKPIINEKEAQDSLCHRMLSRMLHQACVNCVRWSPDGTLLACGGDDRALTIWEFGGRINSAGTIGSKDGINVEKYREKYRLLGHTMDLLHLEWSKDGRFLASCGMDNTTIIWDAHNFLHKVMVLDKNRGGHDASVKGLSWDPIGKFLVTQAADKTLKIWRTDNWQCVKVIKEPFLESSPTTMFCRMDWSPDGAYLIAPSSMNNGGPTAQLIRRKDWDISLDLVGHRKATTVVRVCPRLINYTNYKGVRLLVSCIAVGSRDKTLSVWLVPRVDRPLIVLHKLFKHSILDFSWHDLHLIICSMDGSVKSIMFNEEEVGHLLSATEMGDVCEKLYSTLPTQYNHQGVLSGSSLLNKTNGNVFVDDYEKFVEKKTLEKKILERNAVLDEARKKEELMQRATVGSKAVSLSSLPQPTAAFAKVVSETEKLEQVVKPVEPIRISEQSEMRTKSGKRRIQPVFVASLVSTEPEVSAVDEPMDQSFTQSAQAALEPAHLIAVVGPEVVDSVIPKSPVIQPITIVEKEEPVLKKPKQLPLLSEKPQLRPLPVANLRLGIMNGGHLILAEPIQKRQLVAEVKTTECEVDVVQVMNEFGNSGVKLSMLRGLAGKTERWNRTLEPVVALLSINSKWTVAACFDRSISIFSTISGRSMCTLTVNSIPSTMALRKNYLSVCSATGHIYVWDLEKRTFMLSRSDFTDVFEEGDKLLCHQLTKDGIPVLSFSSHKSWAFSYSFKCWLSVTEDFVLRNANPAMEGARPTVSEVLLLELKSLTNRQMNTADLADEALATALENRLSTARGLGIPEEFRLYFLSCIQTLVRTKSVGKVRELVSELCYEELICGKLKREEILSEVYMTVRFVPEFADIAQDLCYLFPQADSSPLSQASVH